MKMKSKACMPASRQRGLTLLEVVAAIAILGTILVGVVLAKARHTRQIAEARQLRGLVEVTDDLLTGWWADKDGVPIEESGEVMRGGTYVWATRRIANVAVEELGARVVRVEVREQPAEQGVGPGDRDPVVMAVELVLRDPDHEASQPESPDSVEVREERRPTP